MLKIYMLKESQNGILKDFINVVTLATSPCPP